MSREDVLAVLWALENDLRLQAVQWSHTYFAFLNDGKPEEAQKALGIYEGLQTAILALQEKRRGLGGERDDRGHRESAVEGETDPQAAPRNQGTE